ncbi:hypothetical protein ABFS58_004617 [Escherichia coli]
MATSGYDKPAGKVHAQEVFRPQHAMHTIAAWIDAEVFLHLVYDREAAVND